MAPNEKYLIEASIDTIPWWVIEAKTYKVKLKLYIKQQTHTLLEKEILTNVSNVINKPDNQIQNQESEMPSVEVTTERNTTDFSIVWDESKGALYRYARSHTE